MMKFYGLIFLVIVYMASGQDHTCICEMHCDTNSEVAAHGPLQPTSCQDIKTRSPKSKSGIYLIGTNGKTKSVYCNMDTLCGSEGGWTRVGYLDMTDKLQSCPEGTRLYQTNGVRACGRPVTSRGSCTKPIIYSTYGIKYTQVCGRVRGYQYASPDAMEPNIGGITHHNNINSYYVDGISLTIASSPRKHLWTFAAGYSEKESNIYTCPCNQNSQQANKVQSFVGKNYFCESGNSAPRGWQARLYTTDRLFDGKQYNDRERTCLTSSLPWFHRILQSPTTECIEARICGDEGTSNEDVPIDQLEIYVK